MKTPPKPPKLVLCQRNWNGQFKYSQFIGREETALFIASQPLEPGQVEQVRNDAEHFAETMAQAGDWHVDEEHPAAAAGLGELDEPDVA